MSKKKINFTQREIEELFRRLFNVISETKSNKNDLISKEQAKYIFRVLSRDITRKKNYLYDSFKPKDNFLKKLAEEKINDIDNTKYIMVGKNCDVVEWR